VASQFAFQSVDEVAVHAGDLLAASFGHQRDATVHVFQQADTRYIMCVGMNLFQGKEA